MKCTALADNRTNNPALETEHGLSVLISHGHKDHAGGLKHFLAINDKAKVIVSPDAMSGKFYSRRGHLHSITSDWPNIPEERLLRVDKSCEIADGITVMAHIPQVHPKPIGNQNLFIETEEGSFVPDISGLKLGRF